MEEFERRQHYELELLKEKLNRWITDDKAEEVTEETLERIDKELIDLQARMLCLDMLDALINKPLSSENDEDDSSEEERAKVARILFAEHLLDALIEGITDRCEHFDEYYLQEGISIDDQAEEEEEEAEDRDTALFQMAAKRGFLNRLDLKFRDDICKEAEVDEEKSEDLPEEPQETSDSQEDKNRKLSVKMCIGTLEVILKGLKERREDVEEYYFKEDGFTIEEDPET